MDFLHADSHASTTPIAVCLEHRFGTIALPSKQLIPAAMSLPVLSIPMRHFLEVARTGSVSQAAARLFVAASAVSRQIAKLEQDLGTPLCGRQPRGMTLTPAGQRLAVHLGNAVLDAEDAMEQVRHLGGRAAARVRVCCTEGFAGDSCRR